MRVLGLDCGIASVGWAVLEVAEGREGIIAAGTRMFDAPETDKERQPKSELRRIYRGQRRVIRRRRQRMNAVRRILHAHGLLASGTADALRYQGIDPWQARAAARGRLLSPQELAVALGHIARHRGFKSNAKSRGNDPEGSKMKKAMAETQEKMAGRTFGEFVAASPGRKRNRDGDYARTPLRDDLAHEARAIFAAQRRLGNQAATPSLEQAFTEAAFFQRPLQDSEKLLANCAFEPAEKRTAKRAYSFELFRYLSRLNTLELREGKLTRRITPAELHAAIAAFGQSRKISFTALRKIIGLADEAQFSTVRKQDEGGDVVARHGEAALGAAILRGVIGPAAWERLATTPATLDRIAEIISFRETAEAIRAGLEELPLDPATVETLIAATQAGSFDKFTGAGHMSAKAARNIIPHLAEGLVYSEACARHGYDHVTSREGNAFDVKAHGKEALKRILKGEVIDRSLVGSPIARKALIEAVKQVKAVVEEYGIPDAIHIELARDVGKGIDERREIESGIEKRNKEKERLRARFAEDVGRPCSSAEDLLRYELWLQQNGRCLYSDTTISPADIAADSNAVQVDHILPWSRFGDDSFNNKTLCTARANQQKRGRTPFEWFAADKTEADWEAYAARVQSLPTLKGFKRRNYTIKDAANLEQKFRDRNLNDTRWTCRLLAECLKQLYPRGEGTRRVFTRPGALTDRLRRGWGLQKMKKDEKGQRIPDDRHHALDAIVVAACTESQLQRLTAAFKKEEASGSPRDFRALDAPWPGFRQDVMAAVEKVFVSRAERRRARGEAHAATIRSVSERDNGKLVFERKRIADLKPADLDRVKDPERNAATIASLRAWIEAGKPQGAPPLSPRGDPIAKVTLLTTKKPDVLVRNGAVDRGEMARVDVFRKQNKKGAWQFYLVPVYPHQIATMETPPNRACQAYKDEKEWPAIDSECEFLWSLTPMNYLEIETGKGALLAGYYRGFDRGTGALKISHDRNSSDEIAGIGARTLKTFNKYTIDRLGKRHLVEQERRTWRGKVCT
ncbi:type II CRISPR RNA-guided endonuclease Cas9 [Aestuariivirga sp.]|uniref:type II CRISPR RNA-guided endonuclease Cas9 n=1 Tax=Aestuariivirga sp. TaxID=2650926 RepID=UPI0025BD85FD|nr:type II CRISPR RNA-guided endonuclease Cas9 [Aestuariivirga sp.]